MPMWDYSDMFIRKVSYQECCGDNAMEIIIASLVVRVGSSLYYNWRFWEANIAPTLNLPARSILFFMSISRYLSTLHAGDFSLRGRVCQKERCTCILTRDQTLFL